MKTLNVLITGGTGFVGNNLVKVLEKKYNLKIITRKEKYNGGVNFIIGDLLTSKSLNFRGIDVVIHLAFSKKYLENLDILQKVIVESKKGHVKKIILLSSMSAKRTHPDDYGKIKRKLEEILKKSNISYTILRPSIIYGKGSTSFDFIINYLKKIPVFTPIIGKGDYTISPVNINDVTNAIEKCIEDKKTDNKEYDLPGGDTIKFLELINILKKEIGVKKKNIFLPLWFCNILATIAPKIISRQNIKNITESSLADSSLAEKELHYRPMKLKEGLKNGLI